MDCGREPPKRAIELLEAVQIPGPEPRLAPTPARALRRHASARRDRHGADLEPEILLADEPTTALDVTVQAQILALLRELRTRTRAAIVLVTHDLGVIAEVADRVLVMYAGRIVEQAMWSSCFASARHPLHTGPAPLDCRALDAHCPAAAQHRRQSTRNPRRCHPVAFAPRCAHAFERCLGRAPASSDVAPGRTPCLLLRGSRLRRIDAMSEAALEVQGLTCRFALAGACIACFRL